MSSKQIFEKKFGELDATVALEDGKVKLGAEFSLEIVFDKAVDPFAAKLKGFFKLPADVDDSLVDKGVQALRELVGLQAKADVQAIGEDSESK